MRGWLIALIASCAVAIAGASVQAERVLQVLAERGTPMPGTTGDFFGITPASPAMSGDNIVFAAATDTGGGIFVRIDGVVRVIADTNTLIPGSSTHFGFPGADGSGPDISGKNIVFGAVVSIWAYIDGQLVKIADSNTPVPDGGPGETFRSFGLLNGVSPSISGENVAFAAVTDHGDGIYARINGELRVIADTMTPVPGGSETFMNFALLGGFGPAISGEHVVFVGVSSAGGGMYLSRNGVLEVVVDTNTPVPGGTGNFSNLAARKPSMSGENIAFVSTTPNGIYARINGTLRVIADAATPVPDGTGTFLDFGQHEGLNPRIDGENIVFAAFTPNAIFGYIDGKLVKIIDTSAMLPGREENFLNFGQGGGVSPAIGDKTIILAGVSFVTPGLYLSTEVPPIPTVHRGALAVLAVFLLFAGAAILHHRRATPRNSRIPCPG